MPVDPLTFSAAGQRLLGDPNQVAANETEEEKRRRLAQLAVSRDRASSALNGMAGSGLKTSAAVAALLGGSGY
jgi:hypothetical protein